MKAIVDIGTGILGLRDQLVGLGQGLDRFLRRLELRLGNEEVDRVLLGRLLDRRVDAGVAEDLLHLLGLRDVAGARYLHPPAHCRSIIRASASVRGGRAPLLTSCGAPRSGNGTSITSKSRGTTVSGNVSRASASSSGPK